MPGHRGGAGTWASGSPRVRGRACRGPSAGERSRPARLDMHPLRRCGQQCYTVTLGRAVPPKTDLRPAPGVVIPLTEVVLRTSRSSGPGGQHANVTASRVEAVFDVAMSGALSEAQKRRGVSRHGPVVRAMAQEARSQARNRELALERLEARLASALKVRRARTATAPTRASQERRLAAKRRQGERKRGRRGVEGE